MKTQVLSLCGLLLVAAGPLLAQNPAQDTIVRHRNFVRQVVQQTKQRLAPHLTPAEQAMVAGISVRVLDEWGANAFATRKSGTRIVKFPAGMSVMIEWTTDAMLIQFTSGQTDFMKDYLNYLSEGLEENQTRINEGQPPRRVYEPYSWSQRPESGHEPFTVQQMLATPGLSRKRNDFIFYSVQMLLLHEFGHHVCGHIDHPLDYELMKAEDPGELEKSRQDEHEADVWAFTKAREMNIPLAATAPLFGFIAMASFGDADEELQMTHPSGGRRLLQLAEALLDDPGVTQLYENEDYWPGFAQGIEELRSEFQ